MMPHIGIVALAALVPMIIGFTYYHPKTMGTFWMKESGVTEEKMKGANMPLIYILSLVFAFMLAFILYALTVHQTDLYSLHAEEKGFGAEGSATMLRLQDLMAEMGDRFRTFGHGAFHGAILAIFVALPILATNSMFERKSFKLIFINAGYWLITISLMGGIICQWA
ncbi:MAG: hypothetical protein ACI837_002580 [Crocinitomicaceae bacterium]|jgi:hypothetical protein